MNACIYQLFISQLREKTELKMEYAGNKVQINEAQIKLNKVEEKKGSKVPITIISDVVVEDLEIETVKSDLETRNE